MRASLGKLFMSIFIKSKNYLTNVSFHFRSLRLVREFMYFQLSGQQWQTLGFLFHNSVLPTLLHGVFFNVLTVNCTYFYIRIYALVERCKDYKDNEKFPISKINITKTLRDIRKHF